ncbi:hypothetical protein WV31_05705 [Magnetospirillum sp. ME-1]|nr:hypothetical protein WV31_05705 [Magnetospirillum sp. ME-1]
MTILFIFTSVATLLAKAVFTYLTLAPVLSAQEEQYVIARAEYLALKVGMAVGAVGPPSLPALLPADAPGLVRILGGDAKVLAEIHDMSAEFPDLGMASGGRPVLVRGRSGRQYWAVSRASGGDAPMIVQVASEASEFRLLAPTGGRLWVASLVALILSGIAGYHIVRHGIRPLQNLAETVRAVGGATLGRRIEAGSLPQELRPLGVSFNAMLDRLQVSFDRVAQVTDDIAHELRTPLGVMTSQIDVALTAERPAGEYREVLESVREELTALSDMVQRLLFLSRVENQSVTVNREALDVVAELEAVREFYDPLASEAGISLTVAASPSRLDTLGDRVLLRRAVINLVANAVRYTPPGGRIAMEAGRDGDVVRITVSDTGCGIPSTDVPRLFDRFFRVDRARETGGGHMGLGLAIVKAIAELHGGSVTVESEVGRGTRVTLALRAGHGSGAG